MNSTPLLDQAGQPRSSRARVVTVASVCLGLCVACGVVALASQDASSGSSETTFMAASGNSSGHRPFPEPDLDPELKKKLKLPAQIIREVGNLLLILPTLGAGMGLGKTGFTRIAEKLGMPCPGTLGFLAAINTVVGSLLILAGPLLPDHIADSVIGKHEWSLGGALDMVGASLLMIFLVIATYTGHVKPYLATEEEHLDSNSTEEQRAAQQARIGHMLAILKNLGIFGGLFVVLSTGSVLGKLPFRQDIFGRTLSCVPCLMAILGVGFRGFKNIAQDCGMPAPPIAAILALLFSGGGSFLVIIARYLPGYKLVSRGPEYSLAATTIGCSMVAIFLAIATYSGHVVKLGKAVKEQDKELEKQNIGKNLSLIGCQLVIMGAGLLNP